MYECLPPTGSNDILTAVNVDSTLEQDASFTITVEGTTNNMEETVRNELLLAVLVRTKGNKVEAARLLGLSLKTVYNRLNALVEAKNSAH